MRTTTIQVSAATRKRLARLKRSARETYDDVIGRMLAEPPANVGAAAHLGGPAAEAVAELVTALRVRYGARLKRVILYGSHARGTAGPDSDVDLLVVLEGPVDVSREISHLVDLSYPLDVKHQVLLSAQPISEEDYAFRVTPLLVNVRKEGIPL